MIKIVSLALLLWSGVVSSKKTPEVSDEEIYKNSTVQSCYGITMEDSVASCMRAVALRSEREYNNAYKNFSERNAARKDGFNNYDDFSQAAEEAKKYWDKYVEQHCLASAYMMKSDTDAFHIAEDDCKAVLYAERVNFYKNYHYY